jgi:hypothetical protein
MTSDPAVLVLSARTKLNRDELVTLLASLVRPGGPYRGGGTSQPVQDDANRVT